ncbi:MAG TPA: NDP-sugar synthase [Actinomycetota bacterium]|nr:NDP-sugar synthase [Actinomycetota bacterium]
MSGASDVVGIGLAGGQGVRARPLTLKAPGYLRSKAAMAFVGRRLIRWVIDILAAEGIKEYYLIAHGKENRYQIKVLIGYGEPLGVDVQYSPVRFDALSTGSADSTLRLLEHWDIRRPALVFPTDSVIDFDLEPMIRAHHEQGAAVTIAAMTRAPTEVAEKYGVMLTDPLCRIFEFVEKPSLAELRDHFQVTEPVEFDRLPLLTNAGFYLLDPVVLRQAAGHPELAAMRRERLDFGKDLLPWLVAKGYPVFACPVRRIGDLGNVADYVETMVDVLHGGFGSMARLMGPPYDPEQHVWVAPESLHLRDDRSGKTLQEKMAEGLVTIGPAARVGRYTVIEPGAVITESNLDDDVEIREGAYVARSQVRDGAIVGPGATVRNSVVGSMSEIRSERGRATVIEDFVALGDEVVVAPGARLDGGASVYPRLKVPAGIRVPPGGELTSAQDVLDLL